MPCASAANRGVKIKLLVSNWNLEALPQVYLKSLVFAQCGNPRGHACGSSGFIPFARVIHSKTMVIDNQIAWGHEQLERRLFRPVAQSGSSCATRKWPNVWRPCEQIWSSRIASL
jgi:hypothetical protein